MTKQTAIKLQVEIREDRTVHLASDVPAGPAEIIVLVREEENGEQRAAPSPIGLFRDEPELVDEVMTEVRAMRASSRMRPSV